MRLKTTALPLLAVLGLSMVTGCETDAEAAEKLRIKQVAATKALSDDLIWVGRVTGHEDDKIVIEYGAADPASVRLARIKAFRRDCTPGTLAGQEYSAAIVAFAPVGSRIAVVRSRERDGRFRSPQEHKGFVHALRPDGKTPDVSAASLNEQLVRDGLAVPNPKPAGGPALASFMAARKGAYSAKDYFYWSRFVNAYGAAHAGEVGTLGECIARDAALALEQEQYRKQEGEDRRRRQREAARAERINRAQQAAEQKAHRRKVDALIDGQNRYDKAMESYWKGPDGQFLTSDDETGREPRAEDFGLPAGGLGGGGRSCDGDGDGVCYE